jgi:hypothetical protein
MSKEIMNIDFLQQLYDITWILADFCRDKRQGLTSDQFRPKAGIDPAVLTALTDANKLLSQALTILNKPDEDYEGHIPEEIIEEVEIDESMIKRNKDLPREVDLD